MKTPNDPRHQKRITRMQQIFSHSFNSPTSTTEAAPIIEHMTEIDRHITDSAPEWPIDKISKIDLAILRQAIWELVFESKEPPKVIIDEAVELAKSFGNEHSSQFVNGVLGTVIKSKMHPKKEAVS